MKGWVYVISNKSMPGLVKIGYTMKDPEIRAADLNGTGIPTPYLVEYEVLVDEPLKIEQAVHAHLARNREGKEWFKLSPEAAVAGIKQVVSNGAFLENHKRVDRQKAEESAQRAREIQRLQEVKRQEQFVATAARKKATSELHEQRKSAVNAKFKELRNAIPENSFWGTFAITAFGIAVVFSFLLEDATDGGLIFVGVFFGFIVTPFIIGYFENEAKKTPQYKAIEQKHDRIIASIDARINSLK